MFTGLIREIAEVQSFQGDKLCLRSKHKPNLGDSIAINGACLSVVSIFSGGFCVELSAQTVATIATDRLVGKVHIEPAMLLGDRVEGHLVQGHIDTIGVIKKIQKDANNSHTITIKVDNSFMHLIAPKGSIAVDGISLTVSHTDSDSFTITIIPITMRETLFYSYKVGVRVNIETDMFARYIANILDHNKRKESGWSQIDKLHALY